MKNLKIVILSAVAALLTAAPHAGAHVTYTNRNFGTFQGNNNYAQQTLTGQTIAGSYGWADATDADYGDSHRLRAFRFTLANAGVVNLSVQAATGILPAFSIYRGLAHVAPFLADHDATPISQKYQSDLGTGFKEGALNALGNWAIGNDDEYNTAGDATSGIKTPASLSYLTYVGHAADGTAANFGLASGIVGDGLADGFVTGTFNLAAGDYSVFFGGANYYAQQTEAAPFVTYAITPTLTVVPEPATTALFVAGLALLWRCRQWRRGSREA